MAPYSHLEPEPYTKKFIPCQVGPHIYDNTGVHPISPDSELVVTNSP